MRRDCGVGATTVTPAKALQLNMIYAGVASIERTGVALDFNHRGLTYIDGRTEGRVTTEHYLANAAWGRLYLLTVRTTRDANGNATGTLTRTIVGSRGWGDARILTYSKPYLYVLTDGGAFRRYTVGRTYAASKLVTLSRTGWGGVRTLSRGVPWIVGTNSRGADLVDDVFISLNSAGQLVEYHVPQYDPTKYRRYTLASSGWRGMKYAAAGACETGDARPLLGITRTGEAYGYMDADDTDLSGKDIRSAGRLATGWFGSFSD